MFNLAIDSKWRGCDIVRLQVEDVAPHGHAVDRATVRQKKTGQPVRFEMTEHTLQPLTTTSEPPTRRRVRTSLAAPPRLQPSYYDTAICSAVGKWISSNRACLQLVWHTFAAANQGDTFTVAPAACAQCNSF